MSRVNVPTPNAVPHPAGRWLPLVAIALVALYILFPTAGSNVGALTPNGRVARLNLDCATRSRTLYAQRTAHGGISIDERSLLEDMGRLATLAPSRDSIRKLAILQAELDDPGWRSSVLRLRSLSRTESLLDLDREIALWAMVLGGRRLENGSVPSVLKSIDAMDLGWFGHLARAQLFDRVGSQAQARSARGRADAAGLRLHRFAAARYLTAFAGSLLLVLLWFTWSRSNRRDPRPAAPISLSDPQAGALYSVFVTYIAGYIVLRLLVPRILSYWSGGAALAPMQLSLATSLVTLVSLVPPLVLFIAQRRRWGFALSDISLARCRWTTVVVEGVGGYLVSVPVLLAVSALSALAFRGFESPLSPSIIAFMSSQDAAARAMLGVQAVVVAPIAEEVLFRGVFFHSLAARSGVRVAAVVSSLVFALLHPQNPVGFLGIFGLGMLFAGLTRRSGLLLSAIVAHALNNATIFVMLHLAMGS